jgi:hypothetical protein
MDLDGAQALVVAQGHDDAEHPGPLCLSPVSDVLIGGGLAVEIIFVAGILQMVLEFLLGLPPALANRAHLLRGW